MRLRYNSIIRVISSGVALSARTFFGTLREVSVTQPSRGKSKSQVPHHASEFARRVQGRTHGPQPCNAQLSFSYDRCYLLHRFGNSLLPFGTGVLAD